MAANGGPCLIFPAEAAINTNRRSEVNFVSKIAIAQRPEANCVSKTSNCLRIGDKLRRLTWQLRVWRMDQRIFECSPLEGKRHLGGRHHTVQ
jgi:hypothetical protein